MSNPIIAPTESLEPEETNNKAMPSADEFATTTLPHDQTQAPADDTDNEDICAATDDAQITDDIDADAETSEAELDSEISDTPTVFEPTVFLVDDDEAVRYSLELLIGTYGLPVISLASAEEFLEAWQPNLVACLVLDIRMDGMSGLALQELLTQRGIQIPIVFMTGHGDTNACRRAFRGGAVDFLTKPVDEASLLDAIHKGIGEDIKRHSRLREISDMRTKLAMLSEREQQVLELILAGLPNKTIADRICLSTRTIESHRARIFTKLHANSLAELVRRIVRLEDQEKLEKINSAAPLN